MFLFWKLVQIFKLDFSKIYVNKIINNFLVVQIFGEINVLGLIKVVICKILYKIIYKWGNQRELVIECNVFKVKGYEDVMMIVRFDFSGLKFVFGI